MKTVKNALTMLLLFSFSAAAMLVGLLFALMIMLMTVLFGALGKPAPVSATYRQRSRSRQSQPRRVIDAQYQVLDNNQ